MPKPIPTHHLCLLIHCLDRGNLKDVKTHRELFIRVKEVEKLIESLKDRGYNFALPGQIKEKDTPSCSFTFDDGYFNNSYFLELAEKYEIPFILFANSYNIIHEIPFLWDISELNKTKLTSAAPYKKLYENLSLAEKNCLKNDEHRPFNKEELGKFARHPCVYIAPHTHTHQPLVGKYLENLDSELDENISFLSQFPKFLQNDFSLPCGFYTSGTIKRLKKRFERIYTINGGGCNSGDTLVNRVSLVNPEYRGDLMLQVDNSFKWASRIKRKLANFRYSQYWLSQI